MRETLIAYLAAALTMVSVDFCWLSLSAEPLYRHALGPVLADNTYIPAVVVFYLIYVAGVVYFAVWPALERGNWRAALLRGAVLGFIAYGTYDLTNMATLKIWPTHVTVLDMAWGSILTALTAGVGTAVAMRWGRYRRRTGQLAK